MSSRDFPRLDIAVVQNIRTTQGHYHLRFEEIYFVLDGCITLGLYDPSVNKFSEHLLEPHELMVIAPSIHHKIVCTSKKIEYPSFACPVLTRMTSICQINFNQEKPTMMTKEELRQKRKEAYQKAKAKRDADPRYQALKEKVKEERKAKYRTFKDQQKKEKFEAKQKRIAEKDSALMALVIPASVLKQQLQKALDNESNLITECKNKY